MKKMKLSLRKLLLATILAGSGLGVMGRLYLKEKEDPYKTLFEGTIDGERIRLKSYRVAVRIGRELEIKKGLEIITKNNNQSIKDVYVLYDMNSLEDTFVDGLRVYEIGSVQPVITRNGKQATLEDQFTYYKYLEKIIEAKSKK